MSLSIPSPTPQQGADGGLPEPAPHARPRITAGDVAVTGLSPVYEPQDLEPVLDIIFIHGLQGHSFNTWATPARPQKNKAPDNGRTSTKFKGLFTRPNSSKSARHAPADDAGSNDTVFWPTDLLPQECPRARILVFGYQTTIAKHQFAGAVNKNSIFAHSKALVNDLSRNRPLTRPVLFVVHSLGGIVIKETLAICSTSNNPEFGDILKSTAGVVFLGTPHRGSTAAGIGEIARKAASILLMDTNARILDSLPLKNSDLERCQDVFSSLWHKHNFRVKTFQESLPLKLPFRLGQSRMAKVVPDISSCLGDSRERAEPLDGDHREMCRYASERDPNYKKVAAELHAIYSSIISKAQAAEIPHAAPLSQPLSALTQFSITRNDQEKLEHFKFRGMLLRQLAVGAPADNTCQWLRGTPSFISWAEGNQVDSHRGLLQIIGKPGSGKSTLMRDIFEATRSLARRRNDGTCVVAHFFNHRGQTLERCARGMFRSILYQLGTLDPACLGAFNEYGQADLQLLESTAPGSYLNVLQASLRQIYSHPSLAPRRTIIFIDALDECDASEASQVGYFCAELTNLAHRNGIQLDVCISRREYPSITVRNCIEIRMEVSNLQDIRQYISQKLALADVSPQDAEALQETIAQRSNGIFLWAVLAVEGILKDFESGQNAKRILKRTKSLPKALEDLFAQILDEMDPDNLRTALRLLQWAVLPTDRLRIREWHHILALLREKPPASLKEWKESEYYTRTDAELERQIRAFSRGLVEVKGGIDADSEAGEVGSLLAGAGSLDSTTGDSRVVQPIHETVVEFLASGRANALLGQDPFYNFIGEGHLAIAGACLDYIGIAELDGLVAARRRQLGLKDEGASVSPFPSTPPPGVSRPAPLYRLPRRRQSATSFMSSASAHSAQYRHQQDDDVEPRGDSTHSVKSVYNSASTASSEENLDDINAGEDGGIPEISLPPYFDYNPNSATAAIKPCPPDQFAQFFPSATPLTIRHDNSTPDGNMNLRVDIKPANGQEGETLQLFHLRMYDLSRREFSIRRYCRDSARELCSSKRTYVETETGSSRPEPQRAVTDVDKRLSDQLAPHPTETESPTTHSLPTSLGRRSRSSSQLSIDGGTSKTKQRLQPTNVILLAFSNYVSVALDCQESETDRCYKFEYWGARYRWKRPIKGRSDSNYRLNRPFRLVRDADESVALAHISPEPRSWFRTVTDEDNGAWIPPCFLRINDEKVLENADVADVILATGLVALVDECIRERWEARKKVTARPRRLGQESPSGAAPDDFVQLSSKSTTEPGNMSPAIDQDGLKDRLAKPGSFSSGMAGRYAAGSVDGPDEEPLLFAMSELERDSRRSLEEGQGSGSAKLASSLQPPSPADADDTADGNSAVGSARSQTLEEYPALASYALNRVFVHAQAGHALGASPEDLLRKLVLQDRWSRWYLLQEGVTDLGTLGDFLQLQGLDSWVGSADDLCELMS